MMTYKKVKGKYVICKDGVYFALTKKQLSELKRVINDIETGKKEYYREG